jgi:hypothetical protein
MTLAIPWGNHRRARTESGAAVRDGAHADKPGHLLVLHVEPYLGFACQLVHRQGLSAKPTIARIKRDFDPLSLVPMKMSGDAAGSIEPVFVTDYADLLGFGLINRNAGS